MASAGLNRDDVYTYMLMMGFEYEYMWNVVSYKALAGSSIIEAGP